MTRRVHIDNAGDFATWEAQTIPGSTLPIRSIKQSSVKECMGNIPKYKELIDDAKAHIIADDPDVDRLQAFRRTRDQVWDQLSEEEQNDLKQESANSKIQDTLDEEGCHRYVSFSFNLYSMSLRKI